MNIFDFLRHRNIRLIKKEIAEKKRLCEVQRELNELLLKQNEIESD